MLGATYLSEGNEEKAIELFKHSAKLGNADAQESLGKCYEVGLEY